VAHPLRIIQRFLFRLLLCTLLFTLTLRAQATWDRLRPFAPDAGAGLTTVQMLRQLDTTRAAGLLVYYEMNVRLLTFAHKRVMQTFADGRTDQQVVAGSAAGGTGDPVAMPGLPDLLAFAVSSGVVTQTVNQNVTTLSINGDGFYRFLAGQDPACPGSGSANLNQSQTVFTDLCTPPSWANNISASAAFNAGSGGSQTVTGMSATDGTMQSAVVNLNKQDFSSASLRYALQNPRSPKSTSSLQHFEALMAPGKFLQFNGPGLQLLEYVNNILLSEISASDFKNADYENYIPASGGPVRILDAWNYGMQKMASESRASEVQSEEDRRALLAKAVNFGLAMIKTKVPDFEIRFGQLMESYIRYFTRYDVTPADQDHGLMLTADYTYSRPPLEPDLHTFTFVASYSPGADTKANPATITGNLGLSLYAKPQPIDSTGSTGTLRNIQAAVQFDRIWNANQTPIQVSVGGYVQYQLKPGIINVPSGSTIPGTTITVPGDAATLLAPKGLIGVAEAKITLHVPRMSMPIPLGFTYSNRTDLLKGSEVRAHIAISFDTFALATAKNP
jgi:hypothetical protein